MIRGRKPKPDALRRAQGNPGRRKLVEQPAAAAAPGVAPATVPIGAPAELIDDQRAIAIWGRTAPRLSSLNFVQPTDYDALARYCTYLGMWYRLAQKVDVEKLVVTTKSDAVEMDRLDRNFQAMLLLDKRLEALEDRFGLNPQARQQLMRAKVGGLGAGAGSGQLPGIDRPQKTDEDKPAAEAPAPAAPGGSSIGALRPQRLN